VLRARSAAWRSSGSERSRLSSRSSPCGDGNVVCLIHLPTRPPVLARLRLGSGAIMLGAEWVGGKGRGSGPSTSKDAGQNGLLPAAACSCCLLLLLLCVPCCRIPSRSRKLLRSAFVWRRAAAGAVTGCWVHYSRILVALVLNDDKFTPTKHLTPPPHHSSSRPAVAHTATATPLLHQRKG